MGILLTLHLPGTTTVPIVSKVGAGDSMVAGMVLSLARGSSPRESVPGVAAGAAAVMTPGTELCRREDAKGCPKAMFQSLEKLPLSRQGGAP